MVDVGCQNRLTVLLADEPDGSSATVRQLLEPQGVTTLVARTGREAYTLRPGRETFAVAFSHDGHYLATGGTDPVVQR